MLEKNQVFNVLDHGYVKYVDSMGTDETIIEAARMSTKKSFISWDSYRECSNCGKIDLPTDELKSLPNILCPDHKMAEKPEGDQGLLEYLWMNHHATPFEMCELVVEVQAPIMVFREWHRHRTQCLAGDTKLFFDLPGAEERGGRATQKFTKTIKEVYEKFQPTVRNSRPERQTNAFWPRQQVQAMRLRCVNEETLEPTHTTITDVWESGEKDVYAVTIKDVGTIRCSADHRFLTPSGWKRLHQLVPFTLRPDIKFQSAGLRVLDTVLVSVGAPNESEAFEVPASEIDEVWKPVVGWEEWYEVSNMGRVRRIAGGQGVRTQGTCKKLTRAKTGYLCTNLNQPGKQELCFVHDLVCRAFIGPPPKEGLEVRHWDGNELNNWASNLLWGTTQENAEDRSRHGRTPAIKTFAKEITSIEYAGREMTYDIEVAEPWHNFVAEGFIVHNSYNEMSARYTQMPNLHYVPENVRFEAVKSKNKQESSLYSAGDIPGSPRTAVEAQQGEIYGLYERMLRGGVPKEVARINTPVSRYSKMRAKTDLRNWLGFLNLRARPTAMLEIHQYADIVANIIKELWPRTFQLFEEYTLYSTELSRTETIVIKEFFAKGGGTSEDLMNVAAGHLPIKKVRALLAKIRDA
jgi:thymidylate synthase ThyX